MTNAISDTKQPKKKKKWQHCAKQAREIRHILQRIHVFIQFIMANCIWRFCVHDSSSPRDAIRGLGKKKQKVQSQWEPHRRWVLENLPLSANWTDKRKRFLPLFSQVSWCSKVRWMWSASVSKRIIRWNLWSDVSAPGHSAVWKNHYTEPDILDNFGGNRPPGTQHGWLRDQIALEWNTFSSGRSGA